MRAITANSAQALGLPWDGEISERYPADLVQLAIRNDYDLLAPATPAQVDSQSYKNLIQLVAEF